MVQNNPVVIGALQKNILERISLMAQEQIQMEFREEIQQAQQMQQMLQQQPQNQQLIQEAQQLTNIVNARKAVLIAEMTKDYMDEEEKPEGVPIILYSIENQHYDVFKGLKKGFIL